MEQLGLLQHAARTLDAAGIPYMLSGSYASSLQGQPRATHDIDLVVQLRSSQIDALLRAFPEDRYYWNRDAIVEAVSHGRMFNILDVEEGDKIDFWLLTDEPFDQERFSRRIAVPVGDGSIWVSSPEDTMLMKLRWAKESGGSERQLADAASVYEVCRESIDAAYVERWASRLGVEAELRRIRAE